MSGEETVGSIVGHLKLDVSNWNAELTTAGRKADDLARHNPKISISTNAADAIAKLETVAAASRRLQDSQGKLALAQGKLTALQSSGKASAQQLAVATENVAKAQRGQELSAIQLAAAHSRLAEEARKAGEAEDHVVKSSDKARGSIGLLTTAILAVGPALIPIAAVGVGAFAGLIGTAGTALLAVKGISTEMKNGTPIGRQYTAGLHTLNVEFQHLTSLAAAGTLSGFQAGVKALVPLFPTLNRDVALFSSQLGQIVGHVAPGLVSLFHGLNPLFTTFGDLLVKGSAGFQQWAGSSQTVGRFVAYVQTELPNVLHTLGALIETGSHLVMAFAPLGGATVTVLGLLATAINAIPINVLQTMVPIITSTVLAFKGFSALDGLSTKVGGFATKLSALGEGASGVAGVVGGASAALKGLGIVGLAAGPIIGLLVNYLGQQKAAQAAAKQSTDDYTQALIASNLAIDASIRATVAKHLADTNAFRDAAQLGVGQGKLVDLILGQGDATNTVLPGLRALAGSYDDMTRANSGFNGELTAGQQNQLDNAAAAKDLLIILGLQTTGFKTAAQAAADQKAAIDDVSRATGLSESAIRSQAAAMGVGVDAYVAGVGAAQKNADAVTAQTQAMRFSNDAAGLLKQSLDALNGVTLDVSAAQTAASSAYLSLTNSIKTNGDTTRLNTEAGVANRQAIESAVRASQAYAEAEAKKTSSGAAASKMLRDQRAAFIANIEKIYGANSAIAAYVRSVYGIPKSAATQVDAKTKAANDKIAAIRAEMRRLDGLTAYTHVTVVGDNITAIRQQLDALGNTIYTPVVVTPSGGVHPGVGMLKAGGGAINGPGTTTSDSVPIMASRGEHMLTAAEVAKMGGQAAVYRFRSDLMGGRNTTVGDNRSASKFAATSSAPVTPVVHVYIGDQELKGMVRVEVESGIGQAAGAFASGRKSTF